MVVGSDRRQGRASRPEGRRIWKRSDGNARRNSCRYCRAYDSDVEKTKKKTVAAGENVCSAGENVCSAAAEGSSDRIPDGGAVRERSRETSSLRAEETLRRKRPDCRLPPPLAVGTYLGAVSATIHFGPITRPGSAAGPVMSGPPPQLPSGASRTEEKIRSSARPGRAARRPGPSRGSNRIGSRLRSGQLITNLNT